MTMTCKDHVPIRNTLLLQVHKLIKSPFESLDKQGGVACQCGPKWASSDVFRILALEIAGAP